VVLVLLYLFEGVPGRATRIERRIRHDLATVVPIGAEERVARQYLERQFAGDWNWRAEDRTFRAIRRDVGDSLFIKTAIVVQIRMSTEQKVMSIEVRQAHTGP
jgi:hypothetical protein